MIKSGCQAVTDRSAPPFMLLPFVHWPTYRHQYHTHTLSHTFFLGLSRLIVRYLSSSSSSSVLVVPFLSWIAHFFLSCSSSSPPPLPPLLSDFIHPDSDAVFRINASAFAAALQFCESISEFVIEQKNNADSSIYPASPWIGRFDRNKLASYISARFIASVDSLEVSLLLLRGKLSYYVRLDYSFPPYVTSEAIDLKLGLLFSFPVFVLDLTCTVPRNNLQGKMVVKFILQSWELQLAFLLF